MPPNIGNASTTGKQSEIITLFMCQDASMMERKEEKIKNADWKTLSLSPESSQHSRSQARVKEEGCVRFWQTSIKNATLMDLKPTKKLVGA